MIELTILNYLKGKLDCPVTMEREDGMVGEYCFIEKTSSGRGNYIDNASIAVQSYGSSLYNAAELNERVKKTMFDAIELDNIVSISLNSDYNFTDTQRKEHRYQAVFNIVYYNN